MTRTELDLRLLLAMLLTLAGLLLSGCKTCDRDGYQPQTVMLASGPPSAVYAGDERCAIYTDMPTDTKNPDQYRDKLALIGKGAYGCLTGTAQHGTGAPAAFYEEELWFRIDGECQYRGCFDFQCRAIDTEIGRIGLAECAGVKMPQWSDACWDQFYAVLGHEITHGWLGKFHG